MSHFHPIESHCHLRKRWVNSGLVPGAAIVEKREMQPDEQPPSPEEEQRQERRTLAMFLAGVLGAIAIIYIVLSIFFY